MQCPSCNYIQFKASPKCQICGFDSKNRKSQSAALGESGDVFTIFTPKGATHAEPAAKPETPSNEFIEPPTPKKVEPVDEETDDIAGQDPAMELLENHLSDSGEFELDLSEMNSSDSEDWVMGATLAGDHSDAANMGSQDDVEDSSQKTVEFEYQDLGFDTIGEVEFKGEDHIMDENPPEIPVIQKKSKKGESKSKDSIQGVENEDLLKESEEISLETELDFGKQGGEAELNLTMADISETSEATIELKDPSTDTDSFKNFDDLRLEMEKESLEGDSQQEDSFQVPDLEAFFENRSSDKKEDKKNPPSSE